MSNRDALRRLGLDRRKCLIVHQDDLGYCRCVNKAFIDGQHRSGSVIIPAACSNDESLLRTDLDLGIHLTLTSEFDGWPLCPLSEGISLRNADGRFLPRTREMWKVTDVGHAEQELRAQIREALRLGYDPTHIDAHMGCVFRPDIAAVYLSLIEEMGLPGVVPAYAEMPNRAFTLQWVFDEYPALVDTIARWRGLKVFLLDMYRVPPEKRPEWCVDTLGQLAPGVYHFIHHSAISADCDQLPDSAKRLADTEALRHPEVRSVMREFVPITYRLLRDQSR